jgi:FkbM family methyltransferase
VRISAKGSYTPFFLNFCKYARKKSLAHDWKASFMPVLRNLIKYFIPLGFLVLMRKLKHVIPLNIRFKDIEREEYRTNCLCDTVIKTIDKDNLLQICRGDYKHPIYLRNNSSDVYAYRSIIENHEYGFNVKYEPEYIIDAGANIGMASIYFTNKYKDAKIIAVEPEENNFELLKRNTENYTNITAVKAALWNSAGEITVFDTGLGHWGFMTEVTEATLKPAVKTGRHLTKAVTVEEVMRKFNIKFIDILKMDIEGAEKEVFESCGNWINKTKCIIVELHERMKKGCNKAFYKNIKSFDRIGIYGEDIYLSKDNYIKMIL